MDAQPPTSWALDPFAHVLDLALALALAQAGTTVAASMAKIQPLTPVNGDFSRFLEIFLLHGRSHSATTWKNQFVGYFSSLWKKLGCIPCT